MKILLLLLLVTALLSFVFGDAEAVDINPNIPCNPNVKPPSGTPPCPERTANPAGIVTNIYEFALLIGGLLAFGAIVYGAVKYTLAAGNPSGQGDARDQITQALLGLLLLVGSYLILKTLNPDLVSLKLPTLEVIKSPDSQKYSCPPCGGSTSGRCPAGQYCALIGEHQFECRPSTLPQCGGSTIGECPGTGCPGESGVCTPMCDDPPACSRHHYECVYG